MQRAIKLFGKHAFRKSMPGMRRTPINKSLFESWGIILGNMSEQEFTCLQNRKAFLFKEYASLLKDKDFDVAISRDSMRHSSVSYRYKKLKALINKIYEQC